MAWHARKRLFDQAIGDFEEARRLSQGDKVSTAALIQNRADCLAMTGRTEEALAAFKDAVALDPGRRSHPVLATRAWFIDRPGGDYDAALKKLDETAQGGMIIQFLYRGLIYDRLEMPDRALADFQEVIERVKTRREWFAIADYFPRRLALLIGRGEAYLMKGELDLALADSDEAVKFAPRSHEARLMRARIREKRGEKDLADADRREAGDSNLISRSRFRCRVRNSTRTGRKPGFVAVRSDSGSFWPEIRRKHPCDCRG